MPLFRHIESTTTSNSGGNQDNNQSTNVDEIVSTPGLVIHWKAENVVLTNGLVTRIVDSSGNGNHADFGVSSPQAGNCPSINPDKLNGLPVMVWPGNGYYTHPYVGEIATFVCVIRPGGVGDYRALLGAKAESRQLPYAGFYFSTVQPNGNTSFERTDYNGNPTTATCPQRANEWNVWGGKVASSWVSFFLNSYVIAKAEYLSLATVMSEGVLGASWYNNSLGNYWVGEFAEMAIFNQPLTNSKIGSLVAYLKRKYTL